MSAPKKRVTVAKKPREDHIKNSERWIAFVKNCQVPWDNLSEEWKDFYEAMGNTSCNGEDINKAVDLAMSGEGK